MDSTTHLKRREIAERILTDYKSIERRKDLIARYNDVTGPPSDFIIQVHNDFLKNQMEPEEIVAFVIVCEELIIAAHQHKQELSLAIAPNSPMP